MKSPAKFIAVDLGASNGRVMAGQWDGRRFSLEELHRFSNGGVPLSGGLYWNALGIWSQVLDGLAQYRARFHDAPVGVGIDAWGVDFGLLDAMGNLSGNPRHYRDSRTDGIPELLFQQVAEEEVFAETGVRTMQINTLFQLYSMVRRKDAQLAGAATLLTIPDLFLYFLSGAISVEYTEATTTQMYSVKEGDWARTMLDRAGIPVRILPRIVQPGTVLAPLQSSVQRSCGFAREVAAIAVASHDTASAVAAIPKMDAESAFISSGTWSLIGVEVAQPNTSADARRLGFTNEGGAGGACLLMKNLTGLWILQECLRHWKTEGREYAWNEVMAAAAGAPAFRSLIDPDDKRLQAPESMPAAIEAYCRATAQPVPEFVGAFARCVFESLSLKYRSVLQALQLLTGRRLRTLRVVGGGSLNDFFSQMVADACDREVVTGPAEASAFGNVMLQAVATSHLPNIEAGRASIADSIACSTFEPHRSDAWDEAYARFERLAVD